MVIISQSVYQTGRALLISYLNDDNNKTARWVVKNQKFIVNEFRLFDIWESIVRPSISEDSIGGTYVNHNYAEYSSSFLGAVHETPLQHLPGGEEEYIIVTKYTEKRYIVDDLYVGPLYEWMIRFLLEQTRVDWIDWTDEEKCEFRINNLVEMGKMYARVHEKMTSCSLYYIKLLLSSYCSTGILIEVDKKNNCYRFNKEWYDVEVQRKKNVEVMSDVEQNAMFEKEKCLDSCMRFPEHTMLFPWMKEGF